MDAAIVFDLALLVILLVVAFGYASKGFAAALVQFVGNLASLIGALVLSQQVAPVLFAQFFKNGFVTSIEDTLAAGGQANVQELVERYAGFLPDDLKQNIIDSSASLLEGGAPELATRVVQQVIEPLLTPIIAVVIFFVAFALCKLLVGFVVAVLTNFNRIPLVGGVNKLLGFCMGLLAGVVDLYLILCAVWAVILITGGSLEFLNDAALSGSLAYRIFGQFNPFY